MPTRCRLYIGRLLNKPRDRTLPCLFFSRVRRLRPLVNSSRSRTATMYCNLQCHPLRQMLSRSLRSATQLVQTHLLYWCDGIKTLALRLTHLTRLTKSEGFWTAIPATSKQLNEQVLQLRQSLTFNTDKPFDAALAHKIYQLTFGPIELSPEVGDGGNRKGGISWGCLTPPLLHRRSDMPCPTITSPS